MRTTPCGQGGGRVRLEDGLVVLVDGTAAEPLSTKPERPVTYRIAPGEHVVRVSADDCVSAETRVDATDVEKIELGGHLAHTRRAMLGHFEGPGSSRNLHFSLSVGMAIDRLDLSATEKATGTVSTVDGLLIPSLVVSLDSARDWFVGGLDFGIGSRALPEDTAGLLAGRDIQESRFSGHLGLRIPLVLGSITVGIALGRTIWTSESADSAVEPEKWNSTEPSVWAQAEFRPICYVAAGLKGGARTSDGAGNADNDPSVRLQVDSLSTIYFGAYLAVGWEPGGACDPPGRLVAK